MKIGRFELPAWMVVRHGLYTGAALLIAAVVAANALIALHLYQNTRNDVQQNLRSRSFTLTESTESAFQAVESILKETENYLRRQSVNDSGTLTAMFGDEGTSNLLRAKIASLRFVDDVILVNDKGQLVNSARDVPPRALDLSDRDYFRALSAEPAPRAFVSTVVVNRVTRSPMIFLARRINNKDGRMIGLSVAALSLQYFTDFYRMSTVRDGYSTSLVRDDGVLLARYPDVGKIGEILPLGIRANFGDSYSASSRNISAVDGEARIAGASRMKNYPAMIVVTQGEAAAFAGWRKVAATLVSTAIAMVGFIVGGTMLIARSWRLQERSNTARAHAAEVDQVRALAEAEAAHQRDLALQNERFMAAVENMAPGLCMFDPDERMIAHNTNFSEMYGLKPEDSAPGTELGVIARRVIERGIQFEDVPLDSSEWIGSAGSDLPTRFLRHLSNGRVIEVTRRPLSERGWVATHEDISVRRHAEQELEETKRFLDLIIENIPVSIVVKDPATRKFVLVNRRYEEFFKISRSQILGKTVFELPISQRSAQSIHDLDNAALEGPDRTWLNEFDLDTEARGICKLSSARLMLASSLDIATTAEGVESPEQCRLLKLAGVSSMQGYLFKRPGPASDINFQSRFDETSAHDAA